MVATGVSSYLLQTGWTGTVFLAQKLCCIKRRNAAPESGGLIDFRSIVDDGSTG